MPNFSLTIATQNIKIMSQGTPLFELFFGAELLERHDEHIPVVANHRLSLMLPEPSLLYSEASPKVE